MTVTPPYIIEHLYLDTNLAFPAVNGQQGSYFVFWWKDIALGHIFYEPGEQVEKAFSEKMIGAIAPAIELYSTQIPHLHKDWRKLLLDKNFESWSRWMQQVMANWTPEEVPATVPVSLVICTRDRPVYLEKCLSMLEKLRCVPLEILVIDNNPTDDASEKVARRFPDVKYVRERRAGLSIARNTGLAHARYPIIAFTDDDAVTHPLWMYHLYKTFDDPQVSAMTGLVLSLQLQTEAQLIFEKHWSFNRGYIDKRFDQAYFDATIESGTPVWEIGAGVNMAFRRSVFTEVGEFDERLGAGASGCSEDSELWYRMLLKGMTILYNPRAIMQHEHRSDLVGLKKQIFAYMKGHTAAALLQHDLYPRSGYKRRVFKNFPKNYFYTVLRGFPKYEHELSTVWAEMKGVLAGILFYNKHK
jgi:cellulose synthase/poly-beta-1,6-N-acetylglucosamine synthase-like glycosyltransferase